MRERVVLNVNGDLHELFVEPAKTLLDALREDLALTGTKESCQLGTCGACTVLIDGKPALSCITLAVGCQGKEVLTIEGLTQGNAPLHALQSAFISHGAIQCGVCSPGMILTGKALLDENPKPTEAEVREAISGNLCRCTGYKKIVEAILDVAEGLPDPR